ncbi:MAG: RNA polymerase factor sigma-32 [Deltaproteobacteria bacterium]|jgi:RNA polymerase sigma-32 factor|nr:RNA polymerase factor sigma-32 [Deltaproteobacteria bacterium]
MKKVNNSAERSATHIPPANDVEILEADDQEIQDIDVSDDYEGDVPVIDVGVEDAALRDKSLPIPAGVRDNLYLYLREVSRFPLLKPEEEQRLTRRVREHNDSEAAFQIISSHLRLVVKIAMDFQRRWMQNVLDLIQEGNVGLMRAVNKFDPDKGIKFSYYASFWIKAYILKFIMDNWRMVKIGTTQTQRKLFYNLNRERQKLINEGFDPDAAMLSSRLGVSEEQVVEMEQRLAAADASLDAKVGDDANAATRMDFLPALGPGLEESLAAEQIASLVRAGITQIMPRLSEKEVYILKKRLLSDEPVTLREIGERYNITRERVRQLETRLLQKLQQHLAADIKDFSEQWIQS